MDEFAAQDSIRQKDSSVIEVHCVPVLHDNYIWLVKDPASNLAAVVDPAIGTPAIDTARLLGWTITQIWNTHWHPDHTGGNFEIITSAPAEVIGPADEAERIPKISVRVRGGDRFTLGALTVEVLDVPGHTAGHIAFHLPQERVLFVGDTLFPMGCGRLFEGNAAQMFANMSLFSALPDDTQVYSAHEYAIENGRFALTLEPDNEDLLTRMILTKEARARGLPTVPTTIALEKATNPFMRADSIEELAGYRALKDNF